MSAFYGKIADAVRNDKVYGSGDFMTYVTKEHTSLADGDTMILRKDRATGDLEVAGMNGFKKSTFAILKELKVDSELFIDGKNRYAKINQQRYYGAAFKIPNHFKV